MFIAERLEIHRYYRAKATEGGVLHEKNVSTKEKTEK
jgi:hypothetical protein